MADQGAESPAFTSIADAAAASWLAHRASTPNTRRSPSIHNDSGRKQTPVPPPVLPTSYTGTASASNSGSASASSVAAPTPTPGATPAHGPTPASAASEPEDRPQEMMPHSAQSQEPPSTNETWEGGEGAIRSDITAWQSALQSLPAEFARSPKPNHPLAFALMDQPTLRPVEWNLYRQQGGFFPRTPHDFSALMIFLCGQVNPNPCRNCLLRNGPFARCVVSPPSVLAISSLRHACANCTYQMQYKKCTNEPISEVEKARADLARPAAVQTNRLIPKPSLAKRPKKPNQRKIMKEQQRYQRFQEEQSKKQEQQRQQQRVPAGSSYGPAQPATLESFADKLRFVRESSPQSRRHIMAQAMQWQAAITTVESEQPMNGPTATPVQYNHTPSQILPPSSAARYAGPSFAVTPTTETRQAHHDYDAMEEDDSESEQGEAYQWQQDQVKAAR